MKVNTLLTDQTAGLLKTCQHLNHRAKELKRKNL